MLPIHILLIEDNEGDIVLTLEALSDINFKTKVSVIKDGDAAITFLDERKISAANTLPDLILLDMNLPKIDGKEVLAHVKKDSILKKIPVVMLTTSNSDKDVKDAYSNHANCYIIKPVDYHKFHDIVKAIEDYWITIVKLPTKNANA